MPTPTVSRPTLLLEALGLIVSPWGKGFGNNLGAELVTFNLLGLI